MLRAEKPKPVLVIDLHPLILEPARVVREKLPADINERPVRLDHINLLNLLVIGQFSCHTAVSSADD